MLRRQPKHARPKSRAYNPIRAKLRCYKHACAKSRRYKHACAKSRPFFCDDGGFSSVGMVLSLLISLSLLMSAVQIGRIQSASAQVQNVADAAALAAESQVASFYVVAQLCDSALLSMSLAGHVTSGVGTVALCVPVAAIIGQELIQASRSIFQTRDSFANQVKQGLEKYQKLLPFLAAASAAQVASLNSDAQGNAYTGFAVLLPEQGREFDDLYQDGAADAIEELDAQSNEIAAAAEDAEEAAEAANEYKEKAFQADCGAYPSYCMRERAETLAGMSGIQNPAYSSVDAWSFSVAVKRAQAYYPARLAAEAPKSSSIEEQANSAIRKRFYTHACNVIKQAHVSETEESFDAHLPLLPRNTSQMKETELYTERVYPIVVDDQGRRSMHAWSGCPGAQGKSAQGKGSVCDLETGDFEKCSHCELSASAVGKVAAATTSINNGFEYYWHIVAEAAEDYEKHYSDYLQASSQVRDAVEDNFEGLTDLVSKLNSRIEVEPPGHLGAIAVVANTSQISPDAFLAQGFVQSSSSLGTRAAISGATLVASADAGEEENLITSVADYLGEHLSFIAPLLGVLSHVWSTLLNVYSQGYDALLGGVRDALNAIPLVGASGLGGWAAGKLEDSFKAAGLEPADTKVYKPATVNTWHIASADDSGLASRVLGAKRIAADFPAGANSPLQAVTEVSAEYIQDSIEQLAEIRIEIPGLGVGVSIPLPPIARETSQGLVERARAALSNLFASRRGERVWD